MRETSTLFRAVLVVGVLAFGLWAARLGGFLPRRTAGPAPHAHGAAALPAPSYPDSGPAAGVPDYGRVPDFALVADDGAPLTAAGLHGQVWVASFLFTNCAGTCTATARANLELQEALPEGVRLISVSVDPERDTPETLAAWARAQGRRERSWLLATGERVVIESLAREGFHLLEGDSPLFHSPALSLVDARGHLRGRYDSEDPEERARLLRDLALLLSS